MDSAPLLNSNQGRTDMLEMRTSERRDLKSCAQRWYWSQVEGLRPHRPANPLWFGSAVHVALAGWYIPGTKRGAHPVDTFVDALEGDRSMIVTNDEQEQEYVDARALGIDMLTRYVEHYGDEPNKEYIAPEYQGSVVMRRPAERRNNLRIHELKFRYHFTYDGVYRDLETDEIWLDEHKTAASIWHEQLPLDDQAGSYWAISGIKLRKAGILKPNEDIAGIMYNFLRKAMGDTRPVAMVDGVPMRMNKPTKKEHYINALSDYYEVDDSMTLAVLQATAEEAFEEQGITVFGDVSASQPPAYFERFPVYRSRGERRTQLARIKDEALLSEMYRTGSLPITKSPSVMGCRGCPYFKSICQLDEQGDQQSVAELKYALFTTEDPYLAYRKSASDGQAD